MSGPKPDGVREHLRFRTDESEEVQAHARVNRLRRRHGNHCPFPTGTDRARRRRQYRSGAGRGAKSASSRETSLRCAAIPATGSPRRRIFRSSRATPSTLAATPGPRSSWRYGNFVRLGGYAEVVFLELGRKKFRFRVLQGTVVYSELAKSEADVDIETPLAAARPMKPGRYQVKVGPEATYISVRKGKTEVAFRDQSRSLEAGRMMVVRAAPSGTEYEIRRADPASVLEEWAAARDKEASRATSYRFVSQDIYGAGELDYYGEWRYVPGMGHSWFPYVTASWVPYRHGRWVWLDYYGWSWVGAEPWGWSPYHWGRWYRHSIYGWGWYPGAPTLSHVWRPALVTFFGYGSQLAINSIGWCPLGPGERYDPWYGRRLYNGSARNVIIADNSVRIYNTYRNAPRCGRRVASRREQFRQGSLADSEGPAPGGHRSAVCDSRPAAGRS